MKIGFIYFTLLVMTVCGCVPIASIAEPAPKNGDYKLIWVTVAGQKELLCHKYMTGTDVNGHKYGLWSPTLQHFDPHCSSKTKPQTATTTLILRSYEVVKSSWAPGHTEAGCLNGIPYVFYGDGAVERGAPNVKCVTK